MLTLAQSASVRGHAGDPLPVVWKSLEEAGTRFLRGQLALIAAGPGCGKSALVLNYTLRSKVSALYFSADSDAYVQLSRSLAILGDVNMGIASELATSRNYDKINSIIQQTPVRFSYNPTPTLDHIESQVLAYEELHGDFPELIVIDNALDVDFASGTEDQAQSLDQLMAWLHDMARLTSACVICLHHVTGPFNDANKPIPLSGVKGQIGRVPELILTLHRGYDSYTDTEQINVSTVKNRGFKADPSGETFVTLDFDGYRMSINDQVNNQEFRESTGWI